MHISQVKPKPFYCHVVFIVLVSILVIPALAFSEDHPIVTPTVKDMFKDEDVVKNNELPPQIKVSYDRLNRGSPQSSIISLVENMKQGNLEHIMDFMDMRQVPEHVAIQGPDLIRKLRIIANRTFWMGPENLSIEPKGQRNDGLPSYLDRVGTIDTPDGPVDILMQRVPGDKKGDFIWKVSNRTIADIPRLYELYGYGELGDKLSKLLPEFEGIFLQPWQLVILIGILMVAFAIAWLLTRIIILFLKRSKSPRSERIQTLFAGPVRFLILTLIFRNYFYLIAPSIKLLALFKANSLYIVAFTWLLIGVFNLLIGQLADHMEENGNINGAVILRPASKVIKGIIILIASMVWLDNMGFKITTLLAGLGVGSIAVALAAQKSIENLIGAITLYTAQPFQVGAFCRFGDIIGTVEEIGLRSTKIRTLAHTLIYVPNATMANMEIENITKRQKILYRHKIRLRTDSSPDQIRYLLVTIRQLLYAHSKVDPVPARVRFKEFGEYSLDVEIFAYLKTTDYNEYLGIAEDLNLRIMDVIAQAGASIAVPTQTLHMEKSNYPDTDLARETEDKVAQWREQSSLYLPEFPEQHREALKGTLKYPPEGSAT